MSNLIIFEDNKVRRVWNESEQKWYFSVDDVVEILTGTPNVKDYIKKLRKRDKELDSYWGTNCPPVEMIAADGKKRKIKAANTEGLLRIIQSIPSPKAEPFKRWLAKVGYERLEEIENPELASKRMREIYEQKGYSEQWIEKRLRGNAVRDELADEWKKRGVKEQKEFAILTAEISKATFNMTPSEYKQYKGLDKPKENLRDHMTDLELIFTMLGEASTTEIAKKKDALLFLRIIRPNVAE
ncbi:MAG TPA: phage antirepressor protein [Candidatus Margulisbacteria bacterium]|nr:phage antirepressor protein [Candidatus Margulisiibacteriota bacterium]